MRVLLALAVLLAPIAAMARRGPPGPVIETCGFLPVGACEPPAPPPPPQLCFDERGIRIVDCPLP